MTRQVACIVEGHADVDAVPILLRRLAAAHGVDVQVHRGHRVPRPMMDREEVGRAVSLQRRRVGETGVVVVVADADDDDPADLIGRIQTVAHASDVVVGVPVREFEAWFLAALPSLRGHRAVADDAAFDGDPEAPRNPKKPLEQAMGVSYRETIHQPAFAALMDLDQARRCASFARFETRYVQALRPGSTTSVR